MLYALSALNHEKVVPEQNADSLLTLRIAEKTKLNARLNAQLSYVNLSKASTAVCSETRLQRSWSLSTHS